MRKDVLAAGAHKATFKAGDAQRDDAVQVNPGMVSSEPRNEFTPVKIDRTRKVRWIVPKGDMLLVSRREAQNVSAGGLFIPDEAVRKDRPAEGVIEAVGPKVGSLIAGQHIIFGKYAGTEYPWGGEVLLFMTEAEVIAVVED